jgi:hypothetical protein
MTLTSLASGGRSVCIVRSRTEATEFVFLLFFVADSNFGKLNASYTQVAVETVKLQEMPQFVKCEGQQTKYEHSEFLCPPFSGEVPADYRSDTVLQFVSKDCRISRAIHSSFRPIYF